MVLWHSPDSNFTENTQDIYRWNEFEIYYVLIRECSQIPQGANEWNKKPGWHRLYGALPALLSVLIHSKHLSFWYAHVPTELF